MNELINWVALNNTLMIRIGFSAVLLLLIAYAFRYFFVPKVDVVTQAEEAAAREEVGAAGAQKIAADSPEAELARAEEIEKLKAEVESLKSQILEIPGKPAAVAAAAKGAAPAAASAGKAPAANAEPVKEHELVTKIQALEARLSEYEIISEEIAEIGILREENAALKAQLAAGGAGIPVAAPEAQLMQEPPPEPVAPSKYDAYETLPPPEETPESQLVITSEVEVSQDEQAMINDFEEMIRKKG